MKRFRFRLARLERVRELERRAARTRLARALAAARGCAAERRWRENELAAALTTEVAGAGESVASEVLRSLWDWRAARQRLAEQAAAEERQARDVADRAALVHREAALRHRVIERLRERRYRRWLEEIESEERKFLDEAHLQRLARRAPEEENADA